MTTISVSSTIEFNPASYVNPVVIDAGITIAVNNTRYGVRILGSAATVVNYGSIAATNPNAPNGVVFNSGGSLINAASACILGRVDGVESGITSFAETVTNDGNIVGTGTDGQGSFSMANPANWLATRPPLRSLATRAASSFLAAL